ncbi:MAG: NAD(P)H-dependent oxidoreductase, partial [Methanoculleus sp.]
MTSIRVRSFRSISIRVYLFNEILDADGIVLGPPNYIGSVTAPLKAVFDRMADAVHCQML